MQAHEPSLPLFSSSGTVGSSDYGTEPRPQTDTVAAHTRQAVARRLHTSALTARNLSCMGGMLSSLASPRRSARTGGNPQSVLPPASSTRYAQQTPTSNTLRLTVDVSDVNNFLLQQGLSNSLLGVVYRRSREIVRTPCRALRTHPRPQILQ